MGSDDSEDAMSKFEKLKQQYEEEGGFDEEDSTASAGEEDEESPPANAEEEASAEDEQSDVRKATGKETAFEPIETADEPETNADPEPPEYTGPATVEVKTPPTAGAETTTAADQTEQELDPADQSSSEPEEPATTTEKPAAESRTRSVTQHRPPANAGRPYLSAVPETYEDEQRIIEWIGELVDAGGHTAASEALAYYRSIGWISDGVEDELRDYLEMFADESDGRPLTMDDHAQSLEYIAQLGESHILMTSQS